MCAILFLYFVCLSFLCFTCLPIGYLNIFKNSIWFIHSVSQWNTLCIYKLFQWVILYCLNISSFSRYYLWIAYSCLLMLFYQFAGSIETVPPFILSSSTIFSTYIKNISDSFILFASTNKHNLEYSTGEKRSIIFTRIFTYCIFPSFLSTLPSFNVSFLSIELALAILLKVDVVATQSFSCLNLRISSFFFHSWPICSAVYGILSWSFFQHLKRLFFFLLNSLVSNE